MRADAIKPRPVDGLEHHIAPESRTVFNQMVEGDASNSQGTAERGPATQAAAADLFSI
jgi:hypothetical protein